MGDNRSFLGSGISFPLAVGPDGALRMAVGEESITQSIWLILSTSPGERVMNFEFGAGLTQLVFAPNTAATHAQIAHQVQEALLRFEPRIDVLDVRVSASGDLANLLLIAIDYRIRENNALNNIVYPFYVTEGISQ